MKQYYTNERNAQIVIALLKEHRIKRVVASPGSTNVTFVGSLQQDPFFEIYSCVDERSAAYMACGLAAESGEPVVLSCTGATASRNYFSALTEAYYRKLPILAITSTQDESKIGHYFPQIIDRSQQPKDTIKLSVHLQTIKDKNDEWDCVVKANKAILELSHHGMGPVHINLTTTYSSDFSVKVLPLVRKIERITLSDNFPEIPKVQKTAIYIGSHIKWADDQILLIDKFCKQHNAVVFTDPTSNYNGKYKVWYDLMANQPKTNKCNNPDLLIHIGEMSDMANVAGSPACTWRVSEDGEIRDRYMSLKYVFEMPEISFFKYYTNNNLNGDDSYLQSCLNDTERLWSKIPDLPFSHIWVASQLYNKIPDNSVLHFGILSPLRSWSFFNIPPTIETACNQGGFGIDGNLSSLIGASFVHPNKLYFGVVGDLSFFYDINSLGNRHIGPNIRILLINNSLGAEFHLYKQINCVYVNNIEKYISAGGHFGRKSPTLVKHYAEDLGYEYISASNKAEFETVYAKFVNKNITQKPIIFEVFTDVENEDKALWSMRHIEEDDSIRGQVNKVIKKIASEEVLKEVKKLLASNQA